MSRTPRDEIKIDDVLEFIVVNEKVGMQTIVEHFHDELFDESKRDSSGRITDSYSEVRTVVRSRVQRLVRNADIATTSDWMFKPATKHKHKNENG